jgi:hypothetical protein
MAAILPGDGLRADAPILCCSPPDHHACITLPPPFPSQTPAYAAPEPIPSYKCYALWHTNPAPDAQRVQTHIVNQNNTPSPLNMDPNQHHTPEFTCTVTCRLTVLNSSNTALSAPCTIQTRTSHQNGSALPSLAVAAARATLSYARKADMG